MGLFSRKKSEESGTSSSGKGTSPGSAATPLPEVELNEDGLPTTPTQPLRAVERARIAEDLQALIDEGVDVDDVASLSRGLDAAYQQWSSQRGNTASKSESPRHEGGSDGDHQLIVRRYATGIGEHLSRHTDLDWQLVSDAFGTDLGLASGPRGDFMLVPGNLVAARWMRGETGWIPGVVKHLITRRER